MTNHAWGTRHSVARARAAGLLVVASLCAVASCKRKADPEAVPVSTAQAPAPSESAPPVPPSASAEPRRVVTDDMVLVPAGSFTMGEDGSKVADPAHRVRISKPFYIDRYEVRVDDYATCVAASSCTPAEVHGPKVAPAEAEKFGPMCNARYPDREDHPVNCVDQSQAAAYCKFAGKRLPTEAEWEYAARGSDERQYPWGNDSPGCNKAVVSGCAARVVGKASTQSVGSFPRGKSPFGAHDMGTRATRSASVPPRFTMPLKQTNTHSHRRLSLLWPILIVGASWLAACASPLAPVEAPSSQTLVSAPASSHLHVRSTPDEDPSRFLGAFVKRGLRPEDLSEADAVRTRCSSSFRVVRVPATQELDESFDVRKQAGVSVGLTAGLGLEGSQQSSGVLRIHYRTTEKLVVEVDADALGRCCKAAPSECTDTVIGEFVRASGEVFTGTTSAQSAKAGFSHPVGSVGANAGSSREWKAVSRFENTYFAFGTRSVALPQGSGVATDPTDCSFCTQLPTSLDGKYFCGLSEPTPSESSARAGAMANAREQVLVHLSETLALRSSVGPVNKQVVAERASSGLVSGVKDERWCPIKSTATSEGPRYESKVLAFVPKTLLGKAASDAVLGVIEERRRTGNLTTDQERELRALATKLGDGETP